MKNIKKSRAIRRDAKNTQRKTQGQDAMRFLMGKISLNRNNRRRIGTIQGVYRNNAIASASSQWIFLPGNEIALSDSRVRIDDLKETVTIFCFSIVRNPFVK